MRKREYLYKYDSPIGRLDVLSDGENITGLWIRNMKYDVDTEIIEVGAGEIPVLKKTGEWLDYYFSGKKPTFLPPLKPEGTQFRQTIWKMLLEIPYGEVVTYGDIAKKIALKTGKAKMAPRPVGGAVGKNPISIIIPCHRVVGAGGNLTGYGGGLDIKVRLLQLEGLDMDKFYLPSKKVAY